MDQLASCIFMLYTLYINNMYNLKRRRKERQGMEKERQNAFISMVYDGHFEFQNFFNLKNEIDYKYENRTRKNMAE